MNTLQKQTQLHYDTFPFIEGGRRRIEYWKEYLRSFLPDEAVNGRLILDDGSGIGEISRGLIERGAQLYCLDVSLASLRRCREINPEAVVVHGTALDLPFRDRAFDHVISIGVLHHTPDCRQGFRELARVLAPGGTLVVFLYNYWSIYHPIYRVFGPVRHFLPLDRVPRWLVKTMQPFVRWHLGLTLNDQQLRNLLGDKLWTPRASFHSLREVCSWAREDGLAFVQRKRFFLGYANVMSFRRAGNSSPSETHRLFRCVSCGCAPMTEGREGWACPQCNRTYRQEGGIVLALP